MSKVVKLGNGEVALSRPQRRQFGASYKVRILAEVDACSMPGQIAALLRREGFYWAAEAPWHSKVPQSAHLLAH